MTVIIMDAIWSSRKMLLIASSNCLVADGRIHRFRSDGTNVVNNAYGYTDSKGNFVDQPIVPAMV